MGILLLFITALCAADTWTTKPDARLDAAFSFVKTTSKHGGLVVLRGGTIVYENYFGLGHRDATPNLASIGKSFTSVAMGILLHERRDLFPQALDTLVLTPKYFPYDVPDPAWRQIKLGHLLAMSSGLRGNSPGRVDGREVKLDPPGPDGAEAMRDAVVLRTGLWTQPGKGYSYATAGVHLVSMVIRHVTGAEMEQYVAAKIARPLGWQQWGFAYRQAHLGHTPGGGGIAARAHDLLRFGAMLRDGGKWNGRQVVPAPYVRKLSRSSPYNPHSPYSLQFDVNTDGHVAGVPRDAFWKSGSGGHALYIVPSLGLVVWKLGGREEQYSQSNTGLPPSPAVDRGERDEMTFPDPGTVRTLQLIVEALRR